MNPLIEIALSVRAFALSQRWFCLCGAILFVFLLFYLGAKPVAVGLFPEPLDKLAHLAAFFTIATLLWVALDGHLPLVVVALTAGIGVADEWHQIGLPGRSADYTDFLADLTAAVLAVVVLPRLRR